MKILYLYAHPNSDSFNAVLKSQAVNYLHSKNIDVTLLDLYQSHFNPIASYQDFTKNLTHQSFTAAQQEAFNKHEIAPDLQLHLDAIKNCDHIAFQFPLWWFSVPAILKGWLDRVFVKGFAYDTNKIFSDGLLKGKTTSLAITTQSPESAYVAQGLHGASIDNFLLPVQHTLRFVGLKTATPFVIYGAFNLTKEIEEKSIANYCEYLNQFI